MVFTKWDRIFSISHQIGAVIHVLAFFGGSEKELAECTVKLTIDQAFSFLIWWSFRIDHFLQNFIYFSPINAKRSKMDFRHNHDSRRSLTTEVKTGNKNAKGQPWPCPIQIKIVHNSRKITRLCSQWVKSSKNSRLFCNSLIRIYHYYLKTKILSQTNYSGLYGNSTLWGATPVGNPFSVQFDMLIPSIRTQGTDEQFENFGKRAQNFEICGTYAQTELGHGTFLRGLETRADYDRKTDEFVLNTPKLSSYKWWPGGCK